MHGMRRGDVKASSELQIRAGGQENYGLFHVYSFPPQTAGAQGSELCPEIELRQPTSFNVSRNPC